MGHCRKHHVYEQVFFPVSRRGRQRRQRFLWVFAAMALWMCGFLIAERKHAEPQENITPAGHVTTAATQPICVDANTVGEEPDILPYWESVLEAKTQNGSAVEAWGCDWFMAPVGETTRLAPMCAVGNNNGTAPFKAPCTSEELASLNLANGSGATHAHCVKRGFHRKCYVKNIILQNGSLFTFNAERGKMPSVLFLADGTREWLGKHHQYYGTPVRELPTKTERGFSIVSHCKYVVTAPAVFIFRMSGHSTYHLWRNNLGPFFDTLRDDFGIKNQLGKGMFAGESPVVITVDKKPRSGPKAPHLLDELLHYFTDLPVLEASEFTEPTCFTRAILGISASSFSQAALRHWLLPRIALRHRFLQFLSKRNKREVSTVSRAHATTLRCLIPQYDRRSRIIFNQWFEWKLRQWQELPQRPNVLYLSRNHPNITRGRRVVNEEEVIPALEAAVLAMTGGSLRRVFLEEMAYVDQIATVLETNILIAPHGGGIANCVWMPPGSVVVEFVPPAGATLPEMYDKMCRDAAGGGVLPIQHISFVAEQDPAELEPDFVATNPAWKENKRLFSNIWVSEEKLTEYFVKALNLYRRAWECKK
ncbi:hypothetical protein MOQ_006156 [Trypanosoma cruzi marinkellei]|uniref:Glycosyltransferase 61 catalytic domain-containing protein n=1 Tax=Trypanosoma cruzi marinkellei TaxID=85056 RepID=K2N608_TRYCR|nr:hypothetical protein MOQ_006156 [Trypanosoma cruzi marinkellei]